MTSGERREQWQDWGDQADHDGDVAADMYDRGHYADCALYVQQAAGKWVKAVWVKRYNEAPPRTHSVGDLCAKLGAPAEVVAAGSTVTRFYMPSRYPDAASGAPFREFQRSDADEAMEASKVVRRWVTRQIR